MNAKSLVSILLLATALLVGGCGKDSGGSSGSDGVAVSSLQGTWLGSYTYYQNPTSYVGILAVDVDANGNITAMRRGPAGGALTSMGLTGTITKQGASQFGFRLSNGTEGGFLADASGTHAGFLDDYGSFGVLQKGATTGATYTTADFVGSWSGYSLELDVNGNVVKQGASSASIDQYGNFTGTNFNGAFSGVFNLWASNSASYGYTSGMWSATGASGNVEGWVSPDKKFAAAYACTGSLKPWTSLSSCNYSAWSKN